MYEYLIGVLIMGFAWLILFFIRNDLRKSMIWSGFFYTTLLTLIFFVGRGITTLVGLDWRVIPDYWNTDTLFNLGRITGGWSIEDMLFMFFAGGIIAVLYEILFERRILNVKTRQHILSIIGFLIAGTLTVILFNFNPIYSLIIASLTGSIIIIIQRRDLFRHAIYGGISFTVVYFLGFSVFILIFPNLIQNYWSLENLTKILIIGVPIEELLYAFSFGLMWAPMYEYIHGNKIK